MSIFIAPQPRDPFAQQGQELDKAFEQRRAQQQQRDQSDILGNVLKQAQGGQGDLLTNLLTGLSQSKLPVETQLAVIKNIGDLETKKQDISLGKQKLNLQERNQDMISSILSGQNIGGNFGQSQALPQNESPQQILNEYEGTRGQQRQEGSKGLLDHIPDSQLPLLSITGDPGLKNLADLEMKRRQNQLDNFRSDRKFESERSLPFAKQVDDNRKAVRNKEFASRLMIDAVESGDEGFFSLDNLANITGVEQLRTAKGAQLINANKEFLLSNIGRAGSRPNLWIEQQIAETTPQIGRTKAANLTQAKMLEAEVAMEKAEIELFDEISNREQERLGYIPGNIAQQVDAAFKATADEINDNLGYDLRKIWESDRQLDRLTGKKVTRGTPLTLKMASAFLEKEGSRDKAISKAKALGYTIPTLEQIRRWEQ